MAWATTPLSILPCLLGTQESRKPRFKDARSPSRRYQDLPKTGNRGPNILLFDVDASIRKAFLARHSIEIPIAGVQFTCHPSHRADRVPGALNSEGFSTKHKA